MTAGGAVIMALPVGWPLRDSDANDEEERHG